MVMYKPMPWDRVQEFKWETTVMTSKHWVQKNERQISEPTN